MMKYGNISAFFSIFYSHSQQDTKTWSFQDEVLMAQASDVTQAVSGIIPRVHALPSQTKRLRSGPNPLAQTWRDSKIPDICHLAGSSTPLPAGNCCEQESEIWWQCC